MSSGVLVANMILFRRDEFDRVNTEY